MVRIEPLDHAQGAWGNPKAIVSSSLLAHQDQTQGVEGTLVQSCIVPGRGGHMVSIEVKPIQIWPNTWEKNG